MNQHTADLIEAIENHPAIDPLNKPEYSTLANAYEELREMAVELAGHAKKTDALVQRVKEVASNEIFSRKDNVISRMIDGHEAYESMLATKGEIGTPWVCQTTTAAELTNQN